MAKSVDALVSGTSGRKAVQVRVLFRALIVKSMDISLARKCLEDLVRENDKVEVPLLGTFLTVRVPSFFSTDEKTIKPPFRKLKLTRNEVSLSQGWIFIERLSNMADISPERARNEWKELMERHGTEIEEMLNTDNHPEIFPENVTLQIAAIPEGGGPKRKTGSASIWVPGLLLTLALITAMVCYYFGFFAL